MAPLLTPVAVKLLTGFFIDLNPLDLFMSLVKLIIIPIALAALVRRYFPYTAKKLLKNSSIIGNIAIFFVIFGVISAAAGQVWSLGYLGFVMLVFLGICFILGYFSTRRDSVVMGFGNGFRNGTLTMVVALEVFGPTAALVGVMSTLVHNIILVPVIFFKTKR
jgi:BASS family bile acid:Na+ symporter